MEQTCKVKYVPGNVPVCSITSHVVHMGIGHDWRQNTFVAVARRPRTAMFQHRAGTAPERSRESKNRQRNTRRPSVQQRAEPLKACARVPSARLTKEPCKEQRLASPIPDGTKQPCSTEQNDGWRQRWMLQAMEQARNETSRTVDSQTRTLVRAPLVSCSPLKEQEKDRPETMWGHGTNTCRCLAFSRLNRHGGAALLVDAHV